MTGSSSRIMSKSRPYAPIIAMSPHKTTDEMLGYGERILLKNGVIKQGETTLLTAGGTAKHKASNMFKIHDVGSLTYR